MIASEGVSLATTPEFYNFCPNSYAEIILWSTVLCGSFYFPSAFSNLNIEEERQSLNELASQSIFRGTTI